MTLRVYGVVVASKRSQISMSAEEVDRFLAAGHTLNVATISPSGHPHIVAMWYAMIDGHPAFWTFGRSQKVQNIRRDARISCLVETGTSYAELRGVELVGTARIIEDHDQIVRIAAAVAEKHGGKDAVSEAAMSFIRKQAEKRVGVVVEVDKVVSWDHSKLGGGY